MADERITIPDLGSLTSGQASDLLLATRGTTGYKMLLSDLAKYMVETYNSSSLAGSAQSVKAALDSLNSSMLSIKDYTTIPANSDLNNYTDVGCYSQASSSTANTILNKPASGAFTLVVEDSSGSIGSYMHRRQIFKPYNSSSEHIRVFSTSNGGQTWGVDQDWQLITPSNIIVRTEEITFSFDAGAIGTRAYQRSFDNPEPQAYFFIGFCFAGITNSDKFIPQAFYNGSKIYFNAYRATEEATTGNMVKLRVIWAKSIVNDGTISVQT